MESRLLSVILGQILLPKLPQVFVDLLEVVLLKPIEGSEGEEDIIELLVVLEIAPLELCEMILPHETIENLIHIAVIDGEGQGVMMVAVLGGK